MNFYENLRISRMAAGLTQKELGDLIGVTPITVGNWERGKKYPSFECLNKLSYILDTSIDSLLGKNSSNILGIEEKSVLNKYKLLDPHGKKLVNSILEIELERIKNKNNIIDFESKRYLPCYNTPSAAGLAAPLEGEDFEMLLANDNVPKDADFAVRISGDSMEPHIHDGDIVYIKECKTLRPGDVGIFCVDGAMYCKQYIPTTKGIYLYSTNPDRRNADIFLSTNSSSSIECCGKVLLNKSIYLPNIETL